MSENLTSGIENDQPRPLLSSATKNMLVAVLPVKVDWSE